jgi:AcrR family transcriptional regulator
VSRRTFYELFANREECMAAVLGDVVEQVRRELDVNHVVGRQWNERVRMGLWLILSFFDREPELARVCVVEIARGGPLVQRQRDEIVESLAKAIDEGRGENRDRPGCSTLTAEGLVGAAVAIAHGRLSRGDSRPLVGLLGELMAMIVLPYRGAVAARRELERALPGHSGERGAVRVGKWRAASSAAVGWRDPLVDLPMRVTYRTLRVLAAIAAEPGATNRRVAVLADVGDQGQMSKLLARLERLGLVENTGIGGHAHGEPNAWRLTQRGEELRVTLADAPSMGVARGRSDAAEVSR